MTDESRVEGGDKVSQKPIWGKNVPGQGKSLVVGKVKTHLLNFFIFLAVLITGGYRDKSRMFLASKKLIV